MDQMERRRTRDWRIVQAWTILLAMACVPVLALLAKVFPHFYGVWMSLLVAAVLLTLASLFGYLIQSPRIDFLAPGDKPSDPD